MSLPLAKNKPILILLLLAPFAISGCGNSNQAAASDLQGVYVDANTISYLQTNFDAAKACSQLSKGDFSDLSIVMMPPSFTCPYYETGCSGEFDEPNMIKLGMYSSWKHETIHYLLYVNTGDPDTNHTSPLFKSCTS
jgi:hypothetical protein